MEELSHVPDDQNHPSRVVERMLASIPFRNKINSPVHIESKRKVCGKRAKDRTETGRVGQSE
jgi:hypothetical protein